MDKTERSEMISLASQRANVYGLLAMLYRQELTPDLLEEIRSPELLDLLSQWGGELEDDFLGRPEGELLEEMAVEYARLFLGPGRHISPHESVHHEREDGQWGQLWGPATVEVKKSIEGTGLRYETGYRGLPDHISVQLEFLEALTRREENAWTKGDEEGAQRCLDMERRFLDEHLIRWVPAFCDKVITAAELSFYRTLASVTKRFIEFDYQTSVRLESGALGNNV